jgi:hypothetical protein
LLYLFRAKEFWGRLPSVQRRRGRNNMEEEAARRRATQTPPPSTVHRFVTLAWMLALVLTMLSQIAKREPPDFCYLLRPFVVHGSRTTHPHTQRSFWTGIYILRVHGEVCGGSHGFVLYTLQRQTRTSIFCDSVAAPQVPSYNGSWFVLWRVRKSMWI